MRKSKKQEWQDKLHNQNILPSPLTKMQRILLMNIDNVTPAEFPGSVTSMCVRRKNGVWRQIG